MAFSLFSCPDNKENTMQPLQIQDELYISFSQINCYAACPLQYQLKYVEQRSPERISSALFFGGSIHKALELFYREARDNGHPPQLERMLAVFSNRLIQQIEESASPVLYKKEAPDLQALLTLGEAMLTAFYRQVDLSSWQIVDIELPLSAPLFNEEREPLDIQLFGVIDLLLKDSSGSGNLLVVDNKTSKQKKSQSSVDEDLQLTAYSYLLCANGYSFPRAPVNCSFQVLRKLKKPTVEQYYTTRSAEDRKRFAKLTSSILQGIENRIFYPVSGWMCSDCGYRDACRSW